MDSRAEHIAILERTLEIVARAGWPDEWETVIKVATAQAEAEIPLRPKIRIRAKVMIYVKEPGEKKGE